MALTYRHYRPGDEQSLAMLFNSVHADYAGLVPRDPGYWRWSIIERPDMQSDGVIIAMDGGEPVGYVAVSPGGTIWDLTVLHARHRRTRALGLLEQARRYAAAAGAGSLEVHAPRGDGTLRGALREAGLAYVGRRRLFLGAYAFDGWAEQLARSAPASSISDVALEVLWEDGHTERLHDNGAPRTLVSLSRTTLTAMLVGAKSPVWVLLSGQATVKPRTGFVDAYRLLKRLRISADWFFPIAEVL